MMRYQKVCAALVLLMTASPALAYPRLYRVTVDGARKPGSEVCFYRTEPEDNVPARFTAAAPATCVPAAEKLDLPDGWYRVFARHRDGYVSEGTLTLVNRAGPVPRKQQEGPEEIPMRRAGFADFSDALRSRGTYDMAGVWLVPDRAGNGAFFPLVTAESAVMIPEHRIAVPLLLRDGLPVAVGEPLNLDAGEREKVRFGPTRPGKGDVVAWMAVDPAAVEPTADFPAPELEARADPHRESRRGQAACGTAGWQPAPRLPTEAQTWGGQPGRRTAACQAADDVAFAPLVPVESLPPGGASLVFFRDLPAGARRLMAGGKLWQESEQTVQVEAGGGIVSADTHCAVSKRRAVSRDE